MQWALVRPPLHQRLPCAGGRERGIDNGNAATGDLRGFTGEVLGTFTLGHMIQRVLVENWEAEKAVEEAHKKVAEIYARYQET